MDHRLFFLAFLIFNKVVSDVPSCDEADHVDNAIVDDIIEINKGSQRADLFEGDIVLEKKLPSTGRDKRDAHWSRAYLWANKTVPYEISPQLMGAEDIIKLSLQEFEKYTCLSFVKKTTEPNWIVFRPSDGCYSSVGKLFWRPGAQDISLGPGCLNKGTIIHEVMHAIGFRHEQSRPDRNKYVEIFWENIKDVEISNFNRYSYDAIDTLGVEYDYTSIMHYGRKAFSKNKKDTIIPRINATSKLGQRDTFSEKDIIQINALYDCRGSPRGTWSTWSAFGPCNEKCKKKRQRFCFHHNPRVCKNENQYGVDSEVVDCTHAECYAPVNGHWGRWQRWSQCDSVCGLGTRRRTRVCDDPTPKNGGAACPGSATDSKDCLTKRCGLGPDDCEFDGQKWCFWKNDKSNKDGYNWLRHSGQTISGGTGPDGDHTSGKGFYLYAEASSPATTGDKARLVSKVFTNKEPLCLQFWYHMFGNEVGYLRVLLENTSQVMRLWEKGGDQGNKWKKAEVTLESQDPFKVLFEVERGTSFLSDVAIDDVYFGIGACTEVSLNASLCSLKIKKVGCISIKSPLVSNKVLLDNHRDKKSSAFHGTMMDWNHFPSSLELLLCHCAKLAKAKGMSHFGIHYYAECWGYTPGLQSKLSLFVTNCIDTNFNTCKSSSNKACAGKAQEHYIYSLA